MGLAEGLLVVPGLLLLVAAVMMKVVGEDGVGWPQCSMLGGWCW
jgi:hypothetical protein